MKATMESTDRIITIGAGVPARIWEGVTASGIPFLAFVTHLEPANQEQMSSFLADLSDLKKAGDAATKWDKLRF